MISQEEADFSQRYFGQENPQHLRRSLINFKDAAKFHGQFSNCNKRSSLQEIGRFLEMKFNASNISDLCGLQFLDGYDDVFLQPQFCFHLNLPKS